MFEVAKDLYLSILESALPIAVFFGMSNLLVTVFLRAALGGKLWLKD